jgi:uncharacterized protein YndB with AHSA1/START domain
LNRTIRIAPVRKVVVVEASAERAFAFFTGRMDSWWPKEHVSGTVPFREMILEPREGGRWWAWLADGTEFQIGRVLTWEPDRRLVLTWELGLKGKATPEDASEVEIKFVAEAPRRTRVELEHRNFERLGEAGTATQQNVGTGWTPVLDAYVRALALIKE